MPPSVLLSCESVSKAFGAGALFDGLTFTLLEGDHVGLVGPNGAGKSTLLRVLAGTEPPDSGTRTSRRNVRIGYVPQDSVFPAGRSVEQVLAAALASRDDLDPFERAQRVALAAAKAGFTDTGVATETLSGGWRKRLAIARELVLEPDVLLLDEPTNHLDVEAILWLESLLRSELEAFVVVSHDRYFLERVARRMLELSRVYPGGLLQVDGSYSDFLEARDELLRNQADYRDRLANLVRREVEWLRRGAKARTSKSKSRIQAAGRLMVELEESRSRGTSPTAGIELEASGRKTKRLWAGEGLRKSLGGRTLFDGLDLLLTPGTRLGVLGPNGSGKTTLLRLIVGETEPDAGTIERADRLRVAHFAQDRDLLALDVPLRRALAPDGDTVVYRDRSLHVASWASRFLFRAEQLDTPVSQLSGGECARILMARLMLQPADLLVLDEPTNDLDIPTLDVLEESLLEFPGALVLVTHDRYLLDRVSTRIVALDGRGGADLFADYSQWEAQRLAPDKPRNDAPARCAAVAERPKPKRLTYLEQREWDSMEQRVLSAEARAAEARRCAEDPSIATDADALQRRLADLAEAQREVERLYARWADLENKLA